MLAILFWANAARAQRRNEQAPLVQPERIKVTMKGAGAFGGDVEMVTHFYKPEGNGPFPAVIFSHGRGSDEQNRNLKFPVTVGHANFWLRKGFAVVSSIRPGYGETRGVDREAPGHTWRGGSCMGVPNFANTAKIAGATVTVLLDWLRAQPWADKENIAFGGTIGRRIDNGRRQQPESSRCNRIYQFFGGSGGLPDGSPRNSCRPDKLRELYGRNSGRQREFHLSGSTPRTISIGVPTLPRNGIERSLPAAAKPNSS